HPEIFRLSAPLGSESAGDRVRLASLEPQVGLFDAPAKAAAILTDTSAAACQNAPFEERFAALDDHPAPFDRFASADDCASFDERFGLAMQVLPSSPRLPPDQEVRNRPADVPPRATVSNVHVRLAQPRNEVPKPRKEVPPLEEDGRTAIYDITARTVYLPSGRRLEAHSGFGDLMDNPRHVHVRMQGQRRRTSIISLCASDCFMGFAPSVSAPLTAAGCTVAPASLPTPTCWARTANRTDACHSAIIPSS